MTLAARCGPGAVPRDQTPCLMASLSISLADFLKVRILLRETFSLFVFGERSLLRRSAFQSTGVEYLFLCRIGQVLSLEARYHLLEAALTEDDAKRERIL